MADWLCPFCGSENWVPSLGYKRRHGDTCVCNDCQKTFWVKKHSFFETMKEDPEPPKPKYDGVYCKPDCKHYRGTGKYRVCNAYHDRVVDGLRCKKCLENTSG